MPVRIGVIDARVDGAPARDSHMAAPASSIRPGLRSIVPIFTLLQWAPARAALRRPATTDADDTVACAPTVIPPSAAAAAERRIRNMSFSSIPLSGGKPEQYAQLLSQARGLLHGERDRIANAANLAALVYHALPQLNWVGFYFYDGTELVVGPFQGLPACVRIPLDKGVCGAAASSRQTQRVADVHDFPGHIACDAASRSELVVPLVDGGRLLGVFDLDSPEPDRFDADDQHGLEALAAAFVESLR
jgi:L-methionine (R)-S-oxide reductase